jgi:uncharacterized membrane protein YhaH (DUF805 family)
MFKNPFSFNGRIRRLEYGLSFIIFYAFLFIVSMALGVALYDESSETEEGPGSTLILLLAAIPAYWFIFAQGAKRCHDRGNSGWFQIIPFYGLWMLFADSDHGENEYGPNPKGIGNIEDVDLIGDHLQ